jgi:hypothetical protein
VPLDRAEVRGSIRDGIDPEAEDLCGDGESGT